MGASISYKLKSSMQGALAAGGDPATSPLYVFGPFLALIVSAGVADVTFGASIWLAVFTVVTVSAMYRYVMVWVTDGSGGSGLSEEEFGSWAVKVNAAITVIEYTLTFLVSMAALVTFIVDRIPALNGNIGFISFRTLIAILLSVLVAFTVNRGPKTSSRFFGPATALILGFLWLMIVAVVWQRGLHLPQIDFKAFDSSHLHFTLGGFARILALMTGIEIFANLVASYEGSARQKSQRAFGSMLIVMGTTVTTMLIVGPAIFEISNPLNATQSVFTQTMDNLLPQWLSYTGTLIGIAVLLSAAAASTQGIQNLALGLRARHYVPAKWGMRNKFDVPSFPAWAQVAIVVIAFLFFGTHEETYLALYAAGVFILLSMTGWSAFKRFIRQFLLKKSLENLIGILITVFSAMCASFATFIIFEERFKDGAWSYLVMVPLLYFAFDYFRRRLGTPPELIDIHLSSAISAAPIDITKLQARTIYRVKKILVPLNGNSSPEVAFHAAIKIATKFGSELSPAHVESPSQAEVDGADYLNELQRQWSGESLVINPILLKGEKSEKLIDLCVNGNFELICMSSSKMKSTEKILRDPIAYKIIYATTPPVLFFRPTDRWKSRATTFSKILIPLDGSKVCEQALPYAAAWANQYESSVTLLSVPESQGDAELVQKLKTYLGRIKETYFEKNTKVNCIVDGSGPARTILHYAAEENIDLITMVSHGRGGLARKDFVKLGSVTEEVLTECDVPVLFISAIEDTKVNFGSSDFFVPRHWIGMLSVKRFQLYTQAIKVTIYIVEGVNNV